MGEKSNGPEMRNALYTKLLKAMLLDMYNPRLMKTILKKFREQSEKKDQRENSWRDHRFSTRNIA